jgi:hypothetical protein
MEQELGRCRRGWNTPKILLLLLSEIGCHYVAHIGLELAILLLQPPE